MAAGFLLLAASCQSGPADAVRTPPVPRSFPAVGLAVSEGPGLWCAEFVQAAATILQPGQPVQLVTAGAATASVPARLGNQISRQCAASFPQPRWDGYVAYRLERTSPDAQETPPVMLAIVSDVLWVPGPDGAVTADLDGDGNPEEVRRCTADEGEHLTIWTRRSDGSRARRWHEYFDWGGFTDPTCRPGEDGQGPS